MNKAFSFLITKMEKKSIYIAMILVQFFYAGMALLSKAAISKGMNPFIFVAYRQAFATFALAPFAYFLKSKKADPLSFNLIWKIFFISLFGITLSMNLFAYAINYTSATFAAAIPNAIPVLAFGIAVILRIESLSPRKIHGVAKIAASVICISGALMFAFVKGPKVNLINWSVSQQSHQNLGSMKLGHKGKWVQSSLILLLCNTIWACWLIVQAPIVKQYPAKLRLTMLQSLFSCIQSTVWAVAMERNISSWKLGWDLNLLSVAYCGIVVTAVTYWLQLWAMEKKGPVFPAIFTPLSLIITAIISALLWKEMLHLGSICGIILLVGGLYCMLWARNKEAENQAQETQKSEPKEEILV